ncbi:hypothetical protein RFI_21376 [Reticulomyxa filosa]|uniref:Uncharacterized protein n=1 Tax=Reticulomyxa filosa TaxID=46433 RepID=X6MQ72_RETFI|nr:hypothetical protein RFI_21376 [Reticulomyxa filosa]|eukprot:ETO15984.1 hypothetical protein RFI_21376 [Reticulomyxa filosa]
MFIEEVHLKKKYEISVNRPLGCRHRSHNDRVSTSRKKVLKKNQVFQFHWEYKVNLGECETEEEILDEIEQSRKITRLIISAVQKGSKFEVSQILEHYGLPMTSRLHFKVVNTVMEQWVKFSKKKEGRERGRKEEELQKKKTNIWCIEKNKFAMDKLRQSASKGTLVLSDLLSEWELPIGALQSKVIRRVQEHFKKEESGGQESENTKVESTPKESSNGNTQTSSDKDQKDQT